MYTFTTVANANGTTTVNAVLADGTIVASLNTYTPIFNLVQNLQGTLSNVQLQQAMAHAMGWQTNKKTGRCAQAAAVIEKITAGYGVNNGLKTNQHNGQAVIALLQGHSQGGRSFFSQANNYQATAKPMLTRQNRVVPTASAAQANPTVQEVDSIVQSLASEVA